MALEELRDVFHWLASWFPLCVSLSPHRAAGFSLIFIASTTETKDLRCASVQQQNIHIFAQFCAACLQVLLHYGCFCCKLQLIGGDLQSSRASSHWDDDVHRCVKFLQAVGGRASTQEDYLFNLRNSSSTQVIISKIRFTTLRSCNFVITIPNCRDAK